jgi:carbamoyl-phosphate synthase small subunit
VRPPAILVLEDGRTFHGEAYGSVGETVGEAVFTTGMTGYQETLTDPSYHRQVVVQTAPHIGNTGVNGSDDESARIWVAGYVVRDPARTASNWRATGSLEDRLAAEGIVGISGIDTRALTRHLRERGAMRAGVSSLERDPEALRERVLASPSMLGADLSADVTTRQPYVVGADGEHRYTVAALDLGIKRNVPRRLAARGVTTHVLPATSSVDDLLAVSPDAVFFSPGPGDPATADHAVALAREVMRQRIPLFGICFGSQILGRALGLSTYKLGYGHRGINQPVLDRTTGKVEVTCHNHGFAVAWPGLDEQPGAPGQASRDIRLSAVDAPLDGRLDTDVGAVEVSHVCLNDNVVEGLRALDVPAFTVQYHPEAAAGPHDADYLFDRFVELIEGAPVHA